MRGQETHTQRRHRVASTPTLQSSANSSPSGSSLTDSTFSASQSTGRTMRRDHPFKRLQPAANFKRQSRQTANYSNLSRPAACSGAPSFVLVRGLLLTAQSTAHRFSEGKPS